MSDTYDKYYQRENYFGEPYPELVDFFTTLHEKGKVLDLGCGQGRDAIAIARLGFDVTGIDMSKVGIDQMNKIGKAENLKLIGQVADIYAFDQFDEFDIILLDSMFHFEKKDKEKEIGLIKKIVSEIMIGSLIVFCIQNTGNKVKTLIQAMDYKNELVRLADRQFKYIFMDDESGHKSETSYRMIAIQKK